MKEAVMKVMEGYVTAYKNNDKELFLLEELVKNFSINWVNKSGAIFDREKLIWMNREYIKKIDDSEMIEIIKDKISKSGKSLNDFDDDEMEGMIADEEQNLKDDQLKTILFTLLTAEGLSYLANL